MIGVAAPAVRGPWGAHEAGLLHPPQQPPTRGGMPGAAPSADARPRRTLGDVQRRLVVLGAHRQGVPSGEHPDHRVVRRSEEHTSELQSRGHLVCRLLLEKKKKKPPRYTKDRITT